MQFDLTASDNHLEQRRLVINSKHRTTPLEASQLKLFHPEPKNVADCCFMFCVRRFVYTLWFFLGYRLSVATQNAVASQNAEKKQVVQIELESRLQPGNCDRSVAKNISSIFFTVSENYNV